MRPLRLLPVLILFEGWLGDVDKRVGRSQNFIKRNYGTLESNEGFGINMPDAVSIEVSKYNEGIEGTLVVKRIWQALESKERFRNPQIYQIEIRRTPWANKMSSLRRMLEWSGRDVVNWRDPELNEMLRNQPGRRSNWNPTRTVGKQNTQARGMLMLMKWRPGISGTTDASLDGAKSILIEV
ncbi:hypothetical protein B0H16DRAFT_1459736 [Mycena metata]|uniref:Uncharacterized protein n=1 Tax=Mycena metata TaxID=1033252 RepID=A0AAD7IXP7_9AGAR|nr:hypothetical protein B0H16DRAFT_1459736 [Mycena metata]